MTCGQNFRIARRKRRNSWNTTRGEVRERNSNISTRKPCSTRVAFWRRTNTIEWPSANPGMRNSTRGNSLIGNKPAAAVEWTKILPVERAWPRPEGFADAIPAASNRPPRLVDNSQPASGDRLASEVRSTAGRSPPPRVPLRYLPVLRSVVLRPNSGSPDAPALDPSRGRRSPSHWYSDSDTAVPPGSRRRRIRPAATESRNPASSEIPRDNRPRKAPPPAETSPIRARTDSRAATGAG